MIWYSSVQWKHEWPHRNQKSYTTTLSLYTLSCNTCVVAREESKPDVDACGVSQNHSMRFTTRATCAPVTISPILDSRLCTYIQHNTRDTCTCYHFVYSTFTSLHAYTAQHARHVRLLQLRLFYIHVSAFIYSTTQAACILVATLCDEYSCPRERKERAHSPVSLCRLISYHNYVCACIWLQWSVYIGTPHGFMHVWWYCKCDLGTNAARVRRDIW